MSGRLEWTAEQIGVLAHYWGEKGMSGDEVAVLFSRRYNVLISRNAIIGKAHRLNLKQGVRVSQKAIDFIARLKAENPKVRDAEMGRALAGFRGEAIRIDTPSALDDQDEAEAREAVEPAPLTPEGCAGDPMRHMASDILPASTGPHKHIWELEVNECRYSVGQEAGFHVFCGGNVLVRDGVRSSYCPEHHRECLVKPRRPIDHGYERTKVRRSLHIS